MKRVTRFPNDPQHLNWPSKFGLRYLSGFSPLQLSGLKLWLAADLSSKWQSSAGTTPATADGDPLGRWDDLSGQANNATQGTAGSKTTLKLATQNGRSVVRFDGVNDFFSLTAALSSATKTVFVAGVANTNTSCFLGRDSSPTNYFLVDAGPSLNLSPVLAGRAITTGAWHVGEGVADGVNNQVLVDAVAGTAVASASGPTFDRVGRYNAGAGFWLSGDIGEVLVYDSALSGANRALVRAYLKARWGTP